MLAVDGDDSGDDDGDDDDGVSGKQRPTFESSGTRDAVMAHTREVRAPHGRGMCLDEETEETDLSARPLHSNNYRQVDHQFHGEAKDVRMMGGPKQPYTDADMRMMARYIASHGDSWDPFSKKEEMWAAFHKKVSIIITTSSCYRTDTYPILRSIHNVQRKVGHTAITTEGALKVCCLATHVPGT